jgi:hypothetical protein
MIGQQQQNPGARSQETDAHANAASYRGVSPSSVLSVQCQKGSASSLIGWVVALLGGVAGLFLSYWWDLPSGAAIVCTFGVFLILISFIGLWRRRFILSE